MTAIHIPGTATVRRLLRRAAYQVANTGLILLYHRVADSSSDPQCLCVSQHNFREQMAVLQQRWQPTRLKDLTTMLPEKRLLDGAVAVTFDDGYADNLTAAKPILEDFNVPATVFVTTGYLDRQREYWWDELERILLTPNRMPAVLKIPWEPAPITWELGAAADYDQRAWQRYAGWNIEHRSDPTARHRLYRFLHRALFDADELQRQNTLELLRKSAALSPLHRESHRALTGEEVVSLAVGGLVEIGAHTVDHPVLSALSGDAQWQQIVGSKLALEDILHQPVDSFAYPFGGRSTYNRETLALVKKAGFTRGCANVGGLVWNTRLGGHSDIFQLPRMLVRDWDGDEFARRIEAFQRRGG